MSELGAIALHSAAPTDPRWARIESKSKSLLILSLALIKTA
jgi:hypothetical protein